MLPRHKRLQKRNDINRVHTNGETFFTKHLIIKYLPNNLATSRVALITSAKVHKHAVKRNRLRRIINAHLQTLLVRDGYDIIILTLPRCFSADKKTLLEADVITSLEFALRKARLLI